MAHKFSLAKILSKVLYQFPKLPDIFPNFPNPAATNLKILQVCFIITILQHHSTFLLLQNYFHFALRMSIKDVLTGKNLKSLRRPSRIFFYYFDFQSFTKYTIIQNDLLAETLDWPFFTLTNSQCSLKLSDFLHLPFFLKAYRTVQCLDYRGFRIGKFTTIICIYLTLEFREQKNNPKIPKIV